MKKFILIASTIACMAPMVWADSLGVYGAYWDPKDADSDIGFGAVVRLPISREMALQLRGSYFEFEERDGDERSTLEVIPLEVGLIYYLAPPQDLRVYIGGGAGYYLMDLEWRTAEERLTPDVDNEFGWYLIGGFDMRITQNVNLFAEAKYTFLEIKRIDGISITGDNKLDGFGINAGLAIRW